MHPLESAPGPQPGWLTAAAVVLILGSLPLHGSGTPVVAGGGAVSELITQQGSGAPTNFGDYTSAGGGLDAPYSYFVEVPAGVSCFGIDIFDPDVGAGASDQASQRDRVRGSFNTAAAYSLRNPAGGAVVTSFTTGNVSGPGDNAWMSLYRSSGASLGTFRDTFSAVSYNNNNGTLAWAGPWTETGDNGLPGSGSILITGGQLRVSQAVRSITRSANLTAQNACRAVLTFNLATPGVLEGTDCLDVQVSGDGGASFATLQRYCDDITSAVSFDISSFIASDTRVRFTAATNITPTAEYFAVDNVQIEIFGAGSATPGHWEVQVDMSSAATAGDDVNAFGIRAHDGNPGAGGTELNIYSDTFYGVGINSGTRIYSVFPYVTSGCSGDLNNFDWDATGGGTFGSLDLVSRLGASTLAGTTSANDTWQSDSFTSWTDADEVDDYGIWSLDAAIDDTGTANFGVVYLGNDSAASPPPGAQPEPDTFRLYLPTDAGTAPVKPYLAQFLTWVGGPNPPSTGNTSTMQVTVRLANPASNVAGITFSTPSNVVTVNVPGSGVVYAGGATVSAGSIVSQPGIGATGDVVWNPGTVAPGSVAILSYRLQVTPAAAGFLAVTGVPGSGNGTRGRWLDETGNSTQTRATFDFGELCMLGVDTALATHAMVSRFDVIPEGGDAVVEWETGSEAGTLGFALFRWSPTAADWIQVTDDLLVALLDAPQGGVYRFRDREAFAESAAGTEPQYALVEVEGSGRQTLVETPSRLVERAFPAGDAVEIYERTSHPLAAPLARESLPDSVRPIPDGLQEKTRGWRRAKVTTGAAGLVFVATEDLAVALGESPHSVRASLQRNAYTLSNLGQEVAWLADREGDGLYFYSEAISSPYAADNVYWIERGQGTPMAQHGARPPTSTPADTFFTFRHEEVDEIPVLVLPLDAESDFWFWGGLRSGISSSFPLQAPGLVPSGTAVLTVALQGATDSGSPNEHHLEVRLNGAYLGETTWSGIRSHQASFDFAAELLQETDNVVEVAAIRDPGAPQSIVFVDGFDLGYERRLTTDGDELAFVPAGSVELSGFESPDLLLFDLGDPRHPAQIFGFPIEPTGTTYSLTFQPDHAGAPHLALSTQAVHHPLRIEGRRELILSGRALAVDYILIAHPSLLGGAERLAELRRGRGLRSLVVATDDVYDAFSHGIPDPRAFRSLLLEASRSGRGTARYVALVGTGTFDYRDLLEQGDNLVPPLLVTIESGIFGSDNRIADLDGDGYPDVAISRIPVRDAAELEAFVDKLEAYESTAGAPWHRRITLTADRPSQGVQFEADSERAATLLPPTATVERVYLAQENVAEARARLFSLLAEGTSVVHYLGHGGIDRIGAQGLIQLADVPGLANGNRTPLLLALTCTVNRFEVPGFGALGEELVRHPEGGALAVWSASGLSNHFAAAPLGETFLGLLFDDPRHVVGDAALRALHEVDGSLASLYVLLGDPTTEIMIDSR